MARDYDSQLLESVAVRRQRLREAVLFGGGRTRRRLDENIAKVIGSVCLAAVVCGGSVGWSFIDHRLGTQRVEQEQAASGPATRSGAVLGAQADLCYSYICQRDGREIGSREGDTRSGWRNGRRASLRC